MADRVLLERGSHIGVLDAALDDASDGRGRMVFVEGAAGTGKTALLETAADGGPDRGVRVLKARGTEIEQEFAFGLMCQLLEPALGALAGPERERHLSGPVRPAVLAVAPGRDLDGRQPPDSFAMMNALYLLTAALAAECPLLLAVDDAHWGDASSLRALSYLAGRIAPLPIALVVSARPGEPGAPEALLDSLREAPGVARLTPSALGRPAVAEIVRERIPGASDDACEAAAAVTAGNPLYLTELLRAVADQGTADGDAEAIRRAALPSLGERVARRIEGVDGVAPALASAMAVIGEGSLASACDLAGVDASTGARIAQRLRRLEVLASENPFAFVHPLVRRSVYDSLTTAERDSHHAAAARLLEAADAAPEGVAAHRAAVRPAGAPEAARAMTRAATGALARGAPDEAARWYRRALEEEAPEPSRAELLAALGTAEAALLDPAGLDHLRQALVASTDPTLSARVAVTLAPTLFAAGLWTEAADVVAAADAMLGDRDPTASAELAGIGLLITGYSLALVDRVPIAPGRLDALAAGDDWAAHALAATRAAYAAHTGETTRARKLVDRALQGGTLVAERERGIWATSHLLVAMVELDDNERALTASAEIEAAAEREGSMSSSIAAVSHRAWIQARQGDLAVAVATLGPLIESATQSGNPTFVAAQLFYLQDALLERSGLDELVTIGKTLDIEAVGLAGTWMGAMVLTVRGRLNSAELDTGAAVSDLRAALAIARGLSMGPAVTPLGSLLALALTSAQADEATRLVAEELELARATGLDRPQGIALRAAGILAPDQDGVPLLRESITLLGRCGARLEEARSLLALGGALRRSGARREARTELIAAAELARACGADLLAGRVHEELRAAGGRPRREATTGPAALTASELRVVRLAAGGASNQQIAGELFVTTKTVETHLSHAYAKLGLSGRGARDQLAGTLDA